MKNFKWLLAAVVVIGVIIHVRKEIKQFDKEMESLFI
jgi:hypothetical protein